MSGSFLPTCVLCCFVGSLISAPEHSSGIPADSASSHLMLKCLVIAGSCVSGGAVGPLVTWGAGGYLDGWDSGGAEGFLDRAFAGGGIWRTAAGGSWKGVLPRKKTRPRVIICQYVGKGWVRRGLFAMEGKRQLTPKRWKRLNVVKSPCDSELTRGSETLILMNGMPSVLDQILMEKRAEGLQSSFFRLAEWMGLPRFRTSQVDRDWVT